jgi:hypothetical protein
MLTRPHDPILLALSAVLGAATLAQAQTQVFPIQTIGPLDRCDDPDLASFSPTLAGDGNTLVVTQIGATRGGQAVSGTVQVWQRTPGANWTFIEEVIGPADGAESFGESVDLKGDTMIVGAPDARRAFLYTRDGSGRFQLAHTFEAPSVPGIMWSQFGSAVALTHDTVVITDPSASALPDRGGAIAMYQRHGGGWQLVLAEGGPNRGSGAFSAADADGEFVATTIPPISPDDIPGGVRLYDLRTLTKSDWRFDIFEQARPADVAISGDRMVVSRGGTDSFGSDPCGTVFAFKRVPGGSFQFEATLRPQCGDDGANMGVGLELQGSRLALFGRVDIGGFFGWPATLVFEDHPDLGWSQDDSYRRLASGSTTWSFAGGNGAVAFAGGDVIMGVRGWGSRMASCAGAARGLVNIFELDSSCPADLDRDGQLTIFDFLAFTSLFDDGAPEADFEPDGELTIADFLAFQNEFDAGCP